MDFHEYAIDSCRNGRPRQQRNEFRLSAADSWPVFIRLRRWQLDRMGGVKDHGSELSHNSQRSHVHHEIVVSKTRPALGQKDLRIPRLARSEEHTSELQSQFH